jgi:hypothetical protein
MGLRPIPTYWCFPCRKTAKPPFGNKYMRRKCPGCGGDMLRRYVSAPKGEKGWRAVERKILSRHASYDITPEDTLRKTDAVWRREYEGLFDESGRVYDSWIGEQCAPVGLR